MIVFVDFFCLTVHGVLFVAAMSNNTLVIQCKYVVINVDTVHWVLTLYGMFLSVYVINLEGVLVQFIIILPEILEKNIIFFRYYQNCILTRPALIIM